MNNIYIICEGLTKLAGCDLLEGIYGQSGDGVSIKIKGKEYRLVYHEPKYYIELCENGMASKPQECYILETILNHGATL